MILESKTAFYGTIPNVEAVGGEYVLIAGATGGSISGWTGTWGDTTFGWKTNQWVKSNTTTTFTFPAASYSYTNSISYLKFPGLTEEPLLAASNGENFTTDNARDYILITAYEDSSSYGNNFGDSVVRVHGCGNFYVYLLSPNTQYQLKTFSGNASNRNLVYSIPKGTLPRNWNKESLEGLKSGDKIVYDKDCQIDFKGAKVLVELYGRGYSSVFKLCKIGYGGYTKAILDTSGFDSPFFFSTSGGSSLCYGSNYDAYKRIMVAGDAGGSSVGRGGNGGGTTGGRGGKASYSSTSNMTYDTGSTGGTQTSGGQYSSQSSTKGTFTTVGAGRDYNGYAGNTAGEGGAGWYCGGGGYNTGGTEYTAGGGSGFVLGKTTTTYPSGYMNSDSTLISSLDTALTEYELIQGITDDRGQKMIITILEIDGGGPTQSIIQYYNGTEFVTTNVKYYTGTEFVDCDVYVYNGTEFEKI